MGKKIEIFVIVAIIAFIGIIFAVTRKPALAPSNETTNEASNTAAPVNPNPASPTQTPPPTPVQQVPTTTIEYKGVDGKNALELLKSAHQVEAKEYSFGSFVTSIDGIEPDSAHFWAMYVNGQFSQVGASSYMTKATDTIKWQVDTVK